MAKKTVSVRLLFADEGAFHHEDVTLPKASVDAYERLIDCVREDAEVLRRIYVDVARLCAAYVVEE